MELFTLKKQHIYGSNRLGFKKQNKLIILVTFDASIGANQHFANLSTEVYYLAESVDEINKRELGLKYLELSNHLENVLSVVSDKYATKSANGVNVDWVEAVVVSAQDYYPFGLEMPGRKFNSPEYRYGFNGKEKDENGELGELTHYDYGFRIYNPRIGKFLSVDPLAPSYPMLTPYQFASNSPIRFLDIDGREPFDYVHAMNNEVVIDPNSRAGKIVNVAGNATMGLVGMISSGFYIVESVGVGAGLGGATAFSLSAGEFTLGLIQLGDGLTGALPEERSNLIHNISTLPGAVVYKYDPELGELVDVSSQFIVGTFTGVNFKSLANSLSDIANSGSFKRMIYTTLVTVDASLDVTGFMGEFFTPLDRLFNISIPENQPISMFSFSVINHTVQAGETLTEIAKRYNTTVENIAIQNNIENIDKIEKGQVLNFSFISENSNNSGG